MTGCCGFEDYEEAFTPRYSAQRASKYRKRGLDRSSERMVDWITTQGVTGATVLEIGGGVGSLHVELLRRGAACVTNLELSTMYDGDALALARECGVIDRITRRQTDLAADPDAVAAHDIVVLHRVVCCYPDAARLLRAAAQRADRALIFSHPPRNPIHRALSGMENAYQRVTGHAFRTYVHDPRALVAAAARGGLDHVYASRGLVWCVAGFTRAAA